MRNFLLHTKDGNKIITESDAIQNALDQERDRVKPHYSFYNHKTGEEITPAGWLVWSTWEDGCGVVYRREDGKMIVATGWQGDFCFA